MDGYDKKGNASAYIQRVNDIRQLAEQDVNAKETDERNLASLAGLVKGLLDELRPAIAEVEFEDTCFHPYLTKFGPYLLHRSEEKKDSFNLLIPESIIVMFLKKDSGYRSLTGKCKYTGGEYRSYTEQATMEDYAAFPDNFPKFVDALIKYAEKKVMKRLMLHQKAEESSNNALAVLKEAEGALSAKVKQALG